MRSLLKTDCRHQLSLFFSYTNGTRHHQTVEVTQNRGNATSCMALSGHCIADVE